MVGGDGKLISLVNYNNATNTTYTKVVEFIKADKTDQNLYTSRYVCSDFAEDVHNNAERAGIKAAWITMTLTNAPGHARNAFYTTDKGLVFINCTGSPAQKGSFDKRVYLTVGKPLTPTSLYAPIINGQQWERSRVIRFTGEFSFHFFLFYLKICFVL